MFESWTKYEKDSLTGWLVAIGFVSFFAAFILWVGYYEYKNLNDKQPEKKEKNPNPNNYLIAAIVMTAVFIVDIVIGIVLYKNYKY